MKRRGRSGVPGAPPRYAWLAGSPEPGTAHASEPQEGEANRIAGPADFAVLREALLRYSQRVQSAKAIEATILDPPPASILVAMFAASIIAGVAAMQLAIFKVSDFVLALPWLSAFLLIPAAALVGLSRERAWAPRVAGRGLLATGATLLLAVVSIQLIADRSLPSLHTGSGVAALAIWAVLVMHAVAWFSPVCRRLLTSIVAIFWTATGIGTMLGILVLWLQWRGAESVSVDERERRLRMLRTWSLVETVVCWPAGLVILWFGRSRKPRFSVFLLATVLLLSSVSVVAFDNIRGLANAQAIDDLQARMVNVQIDQLKGDAVILAGRTIPHTTRDSVLRQLADEAASERDGLNSPFWSEGVRSYHDAALTWATAVATSLHEIAYGNLSEQDARNLWITTAHELVPFAVDAGISRDRYAQTVRILEAQRAAGNNAAKTSDADSWWTIAATLRVQSIWIQDQLRPGHSVSNSWFQLTAQEDLGYGRLLEWVLAATNATSPDYPTAADIARAWQAIATDPIEAANTNVPDGAVDPYRCLASGGTLEAPALGAVTGYVCRDPTLEKLNWGGAVAFGAPGVLSAGVGVVGQPFGPFSFDGVNGPHGGRPPYVFEADPTTFGPPMGLSIDVDGRLSGTPAARGERTFGVCATDSQGIQVCTTVKLNIIDALGFQPPANLPNGFTQRWYELQFDQFTTGGLRPFTFHDDPPPGLSLGEGGALSGTPTAAGTYDFQVCVNDDDEEQVCRQTELTVQAVVDMSAVISDFDNWYSNKYGYTISSLTCDLTGQVVAPASASCSGSDSNNDSVFVDPLTIKADGSYTWYAWYTPPFTPTPEPTYAPTQNGDSASCPSGSSAVGNIDPNYPGAMFCSGSGGGLDLFCPSGTSSVDNNGDGYGFRCVFPDGTYWTGS